MAPRLKVFVTSDGLTDYIVATSSKAKALAAWGSHQDLFKTGFAHETDDADLRAAATAQPGEVLRRPAGTRGELAKLKPAKKAAAPKKPAGPSKAALKKVADLEKRLAAAEAAHTQALEDLERKRQALEAKGSADRARLQGQLSAAKRALRS
ncbi:hypothetical protein LRS10_18315 [Phenylobacterium sp. J426]|uniref:hypothetical protein n=1 Tax=Phenylobacterium sp. J426 TaxID=2898439 RepID=UPI0021514D9A|nr:hypothetical protein [Phenylobacterium sp. J426]MCR5875931.1 hypothetical protein [Phenylobacterium sp. J426]